MNLTLLGLMIVIVPTPMLIESEIARKDENNLLNESLNEMAVPVILRYMA